MLSVYNSLHIFMCFFIISSALPSIEFCLTNKHVANKSSKTDPSDWYSAIDNTCETVFIIHGWRTSATTTDIYDKIVAAYQRLSTPCYNAIILNWKTMKDNDYREAATAISSVASHTGELIRKLLILDLVRKVQIVGFSLGAHIAGVIGRILNEDDLDEVIVMIIGLDPAGPGFTDIFTTFADSALRPNDSSMVMTLATNAGCAGTSRNLGTVNFIANGGRKQPDCAIFECVCSHTKALDYFLAALQSEKFVGVAADDYQKTAMFSYRLSTSPTSPGNYYFHTNAA